MQFFIALRKSASASRGACSESNVLGLVSVASGLELLCIKGGTPSTGGEGFRPVNSWRNEIG